MADILIVGNNEGICKSFLLSLKATNNVLEASNDKDGIGLAKTHKPDIIFLDLRIDCINGIEVMSELFGICPNVSMYIVTGNGVEYSKNIEQPKLEGFRFKVCQKNIGREGSLLVIKNQEISVYNSGTAFLKRIPYTSVFANKAMM